MVRGQTPMSPNNETPNAPLVSETTLPTPGPVGKQGAHETFKEVAEGAHPLELNAEALPKVDGDAVRDGNLAGNKSAPLETTAETAPSEVKGTEKPTEGFRIDEATPIQDNTGTVTAGPEAIGDAGAKNSALVLHHLNNSRSQRLLWLLEELEVPYEIKKYQRTTEMRAPENLKNVFPLGKSPILTDGDVTLPESGAITEYLIAKYGERFLPPDSGRVDNLYFTHYVEGSLMPILVNKLIFTIIPQRSPVLIRPLLKPVFTNLQKRLLEPELRAHCAMLESHLEKCQTGWLAGGDHPTAADFMMIFPAEALVLRAGNSVGPRLREYVKRIHERPAYKRGIEKGGKYDMA